MTSTQVPPALKPAVFERVVVYPVFAACGVTGAALPTGSRDRTGTPAPASGGLPGGVGPR
ncbi:hypothetical protein ACIG47_17865 [Promicromonospora sp. NPDC052451]|uniref:hypothetical protein n=1 Tax=Promicromonospora sp. NPDC052451 TaxID=3364407 RepID=UPI0037C5A396